MFPDLNVLGDPLLSSEILDQSSFIEKGDSDNDSREE